MNKTTSTVVGLILGLMVGCFLGFVNRPSYLFGYKPSLDEIGRDSRLLGDFATSVVTWAIPLGIAGLIAGAVMARNSQN